MTAANRTSRREFLRESSLALAGLVVAGNRQLHAAAPAITPAPRRVVLDRWDQGNFPLFTKVRETEGAPSWLRIIGDNGAVGYVPHWVSRGSVSGARRTAWASAGGLSERAVTVLRNTDLTEHELLYDRLCHAGLPAHEIAAIDIAGWDLHARMLGQPLHALLGTRRAQALRYGDVRGEASGFDPQAYADRVGRYLEREKLRATKLHFPGAMGTGESLPFSTVLETLRRIRATVGPQPVLAYDPYPRSAESATASPAEARELLRLLAELKFEWVEGPLVPEPESTQIPQYRDLMQGSHVWIQPEGPGQIGDLTDFAAIRRWFEAGAADQFSTDAYYRDGLTPVVRLLRWAESRPGRIRLNLHWSWLPHIHVAMSCEDRLFPYVEVPMSHEMPPEYFSQSPFVSAPNWAGIFPLAGPS